MLMKTLAKPSLRAPLVALASQVSGLIQLALILGRVGPDRATDTYFYLFNLGFVPISCIIVGMMYPSLLNDKRMSRHGLQTIRWVTPLVSAAFVGGGVVWLLANHRLDPPLIGLTVACGVNAVVQTQLWFRAVAAEAGGSAIWVSGVAVPPNVLAALALAYPWHAPVAAMTAMVVGLTVGNLGFFVYMEARGVGDDILESAPEQSPGSGSSFWFLGLSSVSFIGMTLMQSLAVLLPTSSITLLNVAYKLVSSVSATFINATMPTLLHQKTDSMHAARRFLRIAVVILAIAGGVLLVGVLIVRPSLAAPAVVLALWLVASSASAAAGRMSYRFLPPDMVRRTMAVVIVVGALAMFSASQPGFSLITLLCAYAAVDAAYAMLLLWPLRDRTMCAVLGATLMALLGTWCSSYV
jgi:hypothetical protein